MCTCIYLSIYLSISLCIYIYIYPYGSCRPPPDVFQGLLDSMVYLQIGLGVAQRAAKIAFPWPSVKGEVCMSRVGDCTKLPLARLRSTISSIKNTSNFSPKSHLL